LKKPRICFFTVLLILFLLNALFFSCKTISTKIPQDPFMVLGDSFSLYTALDVKRDTDTLRQLILSFFPELSQKNQEALLLKTSTMYIGFSLIQKNFPLLLKAIFLA